MLLGKYSALNRNKMSRKQKLTIAKDWNGVEHLFPAAFGISSSNFFPWRTGRYTSYSVRELLWLTIIASVPGDSSWIWKMKLDQWLAGKSHNNNAPVHSWAFIAVKTTQTLQLYRNISQHIAVFFRVNSVLFLLIFAWKT